MVIAAFHQCMKSGVEKTTPMRTPRDAGVFRTNNSTRMEFQELIPRPQHRPLERRSMAESRNGTRRVVRPHRLAGNKVRLSDFAGRNVVLYFNPKTTPPAAHEASEFRPSGAFREEKTPRSRDLPDPPRASKLLRNIPLPSFHMRPNAETAEK